MKIFEEYAQKWKLSTDAVESIYFLIEYHNGRYGRANNILVSFGISIPERQLRYFYNKVKLHKRVEIGKKGKPGNYTTLLRNL